MVHFARTFYGENRLRRSINQFFAISGLTALEAIRQPVTILLTTMIVLFSGLLPLLIMYDLGDASKLVRDSVLALHLVAGMVLGGFAACSSLSREFRSGTGAAILSKPVNRVVFFLAKYAGVAVVMVAFSLIMLCTTLLAVKMCGEDFMVDWRAGIPLFGSIVLAMILAALQNYFTQVPFPSRAFGWLFILLPVSMAPGLFGQEAAYAWDLLPVSLLVTLAILVLSGLACALATRLQVVPVLVACSVALMLGLMSDYLFGRFAETSTLSRVLYGILPNWQHFWTLDALNAGGIPWVYLAKAALYAAFYLAGLLSLGIFAVYRVEVR